jgi:hypothetical protein
LAEPGRRMENTSSLNRPVIIPRISGPAVKALRFSAGRVLSRCS